MSFTEGINIFANFLLLSGLLPISFFIYRYNKFSPWRESVEGRAIMGQKISFAALFLFIIISLLFSNLGIEFVGREYVRVILYGTIIISFWRMLYNLVKLQNEALREAKAEKGAR